ncbi:hypothetical protein ATZ36_11100 [Candidatus Endomicrobiellum trichonymphae]|uniref:Uncharacterized protein n=1 Tax=Endomicrobium trichonymphae TaxID=1408204 RepID=A0A1E5IF92_ENDTX|nr:hypothetical protein ATZ36_11100 [Candidatus Endomicrobium trichonymphae]
MPRTLYLRQTLKCLQFFSRFAAAVPVNFSFVILKYFCYDINLFVGLLFSGIKKRLSCKGRLLDL